MAPALAGVGGYGVALIGEALGEEESSLGAPFVGRAGLKLTRLIEWAGLERGRFDIYNTIWCRPPGNQLEGTPYEQASIAHCRHAHWEDLLHRACVLVPMGNVATGALLGKKGILGIRGYLEGRNGQYVIPTVHPSFIQRGQSRWSAAFINDLQKAVKLASEGLPPLLQNYTLDPTPLAAYEWARRYRAALVEDPSIRLAFDIETPGKGEDEDESDLATDAPDRTWTIERVGFAYRPRGGEVLSLSVVWEPAAYATFRLLLESPGDKVVWNAGFDVPRIRRAGVTIGGTIHDAMVAWHILHTDLPKSLRFVATFTCPWQPAWKHLSSGKPAYYNATDADVELRSMEVIEDELRRVGLWGVYQNDVLDLQPILDHMHQMGMPIDPGIRLDRATKLQDQLDRVKVQLEEAIPLEARRVAQVYNRDPRVGAKCVIEGLRSRPGSRLIRRCSQCNLEGPGVAHFRRFKRKDNPCADASIRESLEAAPEFYRLADFSPSRNQLISYHNLLGRALPLVWDKKAGAKRVSFGEREIKALMGKFPLDLVYPLVLSYRELDKLAGTYVGRVDPSE